MSRTMNYNRTMLYLTPAVREYGEEFITTANGCRFIGAYIDDMEYQGPWAGRHDNLFIRYENPSDMFLDKVRMLPQFRGDYPLHDGICHMVLFYFHHSRAMSHFLKSEYSKMYSEKEIWKYYDKRSSPVHQMAAEVLTHSDKAKLIFEERINKHLEFIAREKGLEDFMHHGMMWKEESRVCVLPECEYDYPINPSHEIFNYGETGYQQTGFIARKIQERKFTIE